MISGISFLISNLFINYVLFPKNDTLSSLSIFFCGIIDKITEVQGHIGHASGGSFYFWKQTQI